ncbi:plastocyanin/azurin family copper-binding protein [Natronobacterium texcoconense]|uniref:TAT (Twin-arginine translocation) pathway signal sequence n=1 Tax=Natronobacterium texcoconense TaxID=1095778 RepID=A0A1H1I303_NATTX|nr:plastocyanin/azurin family copper-binding protein [Natronobacterium texcoconense]SDR32105.1 TAT (twin-arginine translocation) pathway signal sequence [Natronobacterium texcoconense]
MTRDNPISRRTALKITGGAAATALVAGCNDNGDDNGGDNGDDNGEDGVNIEPGTTIELDGQTAGWEGLAPSDIDGETNPTLILQEGEDYEIGWPQGDGGNHNIAIRDDGGEVVDDLATDETTDDEPGDDQFLEFTASEEMAEYVCEPHENSMDGEIIVE